MNYNSVAEIFETIDKSRARLEQRVEALSEAEQNFRPAPEAWSVAEIVEHLSIIERQLLKMVRALLAQAEAKSAGNAEDVVAQAASALSAALSPRAFQSFSLDAMAEAARGQKFQAPETVRPRGGVSITDSLARLRQSRQEFRALQPRLEAADFDGIAYPHPIFGALDPYRWLAFIGVHEERHLRQIESLLEAKGQEVNHEARAV